MDNSWPKNSSKKNSKPRKTQKIWGKPRKIVEPVYPKKKFEHRKFNLKKSWSRKTQKNPGKFPFGKIPEPEIHQKKKKFEHRKFDQKNPVTRKLQKIRENCTWKTYRTQNSSKKKFKSGKFNPKKNPKSRKS